MIALVSGEIQAMTATVGSVIPHINAKRLRPLGVTSGARASQYPDVPTFAEAGVPGYEFTAWIGAFVAAGTPQPIVDRLNAELKKTLAHPEVAKIMSSQTLDPLHMAPEQFEGRLKSDYEKYEKVIRVTGAKID